MGTYQRFWLVVVAVLLGGCATSTSVSLDYDPGQNFAAVDTYRWIETEARSRYADIYNSELFARRVKAAVDSRLAKRGLQKVDDGQADLLVRAHLDSEREVDWQYHTGFRGVRECPPWICYGGVTSRSPDTYRQNLLTIDLLNADSRNLVWRGVGERRAVGYDDPAEYENYVNEMVDSILDKLPPALGKASTMTSAGAEPMRLAQVIVIPESRGDEDAQIILQDHSHLFDRDRRGGFRPFSNFEDFRTSEGFEGFRRSKPGWPPRELCSGSDCRDPSQPPLGHEYEVNDGRTESLRD